MSKCPEYMRWIFLVMVISVLLCGCFDTPDAGPDTAHPAGNTTGTQNSCTFDYLIGKDEIHLTNEGSCYFQTHTPIEFLNGLRMHPDTPVMILDVPEGWITNADAELLMREIDSHEPAAPVVSPLSSYWPHNQSSTVGNEALFLLEGYRTGKYPPALCSLYYFHPNITEMRSWWETCGKWDLPDEREAIRILLDAYPELKEYPSNTFAGRSIRIERAPEGWYIAFIQHGSGVPIISARCYCVGNDRNVTLTGTVNQSIMVMPWEFSSRERGESFPEPG